MTADARDAPEWDDAPVALLQLDRNGRVHAANAAARAWTGRTVEDLHLSALLTPGSALYWETHVSPLLQVDGRVDELVLELVGATGPLPVLLSAVRTGDGVLLAASRAGERAGFERELRDARRAARTAERRVRGLQSVTAALSSAVGVDAVAEVVAQAAVGVLGGSGGSVLLTDEAGTATVRARRPADLPEPALPSAVPAQPEERDGTVVVPLHGQRVLRGVLVLVVSSGPGADPVDLEVCAAVGQQAGLALDRAWAYEHQASVAAQLQRSLLAVDVPVDERFAVETVYRPGVESLEVGGDWFDVFALDEDRIAVVVGDVVGRGLPAASAMGQLRSAVRAIASVEVGPAGLLHRLDRFVEQSRAGGMATLAYAELDLASGRLRWACAGHPPPVLLRADGRAELLWEGRSTPLGALVAPKQRAEAERELAVGERLLLCTDGLFERRDQDLDTALERLRAMTERTAGQPLPSAVQQLTAAMLADEGGGRDDVCVLLLARPAAGLRHDCPADLSGLAVARARLRTWLAAQDVPEPVSADVVLAASELLANAGEHGGRRDPRVRVRLHARLEPAGEERRLLVQVRDPGVWRPPLPSDERGRGLTIVRALVDELDVTSDGEGTLVTVVRRLAAG